MGHFDRYWEMKEGGPYDEPNKVFKCRDCGAETHAQEGWDGEPDTHLCHGECPSRSSDWRPGRVSSKYLRNFETIAFNPAAKDGAPADEPSAIQRYKQNFDAVFPGAPGSGL
jgi:hypothetical protein